MATLVGPALKRASATGNETAINLEEAILDELRASPEGIKFPDLERRVRTRFKNLRSPYEVRKATWKLIGANRARLTPGMLVRIR